VFKKWQAVEQQVVTSDCLQPIYLKGSGLEEGNSDPIKAYAEHLDAFIVFDGELKIRTFNQTRTLKAGEVFFYTRSTYAELAICSSNFSGARLRFIKDKIPNSVVRKRFSASMLGSSIVSQKIKNHCINYLQLISSFQHEIDQNFIKLIQNESLEILEVLGHMIESKNEILDIVEHDINKAELVVNAVNIFESQLRDTPKIQDIVRELGVSHSYFVRVFKRHLGVAPNVFARTLKINHSLSLISSETDSLSDISYQLGFSDQSHFSNSFRKTLQFTPGAVPIKSI